MAPSTEHIDELLEWRPGAPAAATTNVLAALAWGARRATGCKALIFWLWLAHLLVALGAATALLEVLRSSATLGEAAGGVIDRAVIGDAFGRSLPRALYLVVFLESITRRLWTPSAWYLLFYGLFAGAAIASLHAPRPAPLLAQWGAAAGTWLGRFARLLLLAGLAFWSLRAAALALPAGAATGPAAAVALGLLLAAALLLAAVLDYTRVRMVTRDSRSVLIETARSARFFVRNLPRTLALELAILVLTAAVAALVLALTGALRLVLPARPADFAGTQVLVIALLWVRLAAWGAMLALYQGLALKRLSAARD